MVPDIDSQTNKNK